MRRIKTHALNLLVAGAAFCPAMAEARWIPWEAGHQRDSGKTVISTESSPYSNGLPQLYHFHRVNFEAVITWRDGDLLAAPSRGQQELVYELKADASEPLKIDVKFSHGLSPGFLELVEGGRDRVIAQVLIGDNVTDASKFDPNQIRFEMRFFRNGSGVKLSNDREGLRSEGSGMTFSAKPAFSWEEASESVQASIVGGINAKGQPRPENTKPAYLCATAFGADGPSWDRVEFTVIGNNETGAIKKGTRFRMMFSGAPSDRSNHTIPATSERVPPIVVLDTSAPLHFYATGVNLGQGKRQCESGSRGSPLLPLSRRDLSLDEDTLKVDFNLLAERPVPSFGYLNVSLMADGFENMQATAIFNFREYAHEPLDEVMGSVWSRLPAHNPKRLPPGRPLWESSMALCDKSDPGDEGWKIDDRNLTFVARHLNGRRAVFGSLQSKPAVWRQRQNEPEFVSEEAGALEGANDNIAYDVCGYQRTKEGTRPYVWTPNQEGWQSHFLPVETFTVDGRALDINGHGQACGFIDLLVSDQATRLACTWKRSDDQYENLEILPVPNDVFAASALAINNRGVIVGYSESQEGVANACYWEPKQTGYEFVDLETSGVARCINAIDQMVGGSDEQSFLWQCGERHLLQSVSGFAESGSERVLSISDLGDLIARGSGGRKQLLTPVSKIKPGL